MKYDKYEKLISKIEEKMKNLDSSSKKYEKLKTRKDSLDTSLTEVKKVFNEIAELKKKDTGVDEQSVLKIANEEKKAIKKLKECYRQAKYGYNKNTVKGLMIYLGTRLLIIGAAIVGFVSLPATFPAVLSFLSILAITGYTFKVATTTFRRAREIIKSKSISIKNSVKNKTKNLASKVKTSAFTKRHHLGNDKEKDIDTKDASKEEKEEVIEPKEISSKEELSLADIYDKAIEGNKENPKESEETSKEEIKVENIKEEKEVDNKKSLVDIYNKENSKESEEAPKEEIKVENTKEERKDLDFNSALLDNKYNNNYNTEFNVVSKGDKYIDNMRDVLSSHTQDYAKREKLLNEINKEEEKHRNMKVVKDLKTLRKEIDQIRNQMEKVKNNDVEYNYYRHILKEKIKECYEKAEIYGKKADNTIINDYVDYNEYGEEKGKSR